MAQPDINAWAQRDPGTAAPATPSTPTFEPDADVNVVSPRGTAGTVKGANVDAALQAGYQLEDAGATHQRVLQKKYGDSPVTAGLLGVARGATLGLSDLALRGLGAREATEALEQYNPTSSMVGELGGAVAGSFIPGLGAIGELGHGVEEATAGSRAVHAFAEGGKFAKVAARYAPVLARGAVEGAAYGAGGGLSQAALSADPMTAEAVIGDMASGALLGAGTGAAMAAGGRFLADSAGWATRAHADVAADQAAERAERIAYPEPTVPRVGESPEAPLPSGPRTAAPEPVQSPAPVSDGNVEDFKAKYNKMTVASRQNVRQFEGLVEKGSPKVTPELEQALADLEAARAKTHAMLPLEGRESGMRSYEAADPLLGGEGERGGSYGRGQGKISMQFNAANEEVAAAAQRPEFQQALAEHQQALDRAQELLGNKKYPPVIEPDHPVFGARAKNGLTPETDSLLRGLGSAEPARAPKGPRVVLDDAKAKNLFGVDMPPASVRADAAAAGHPSSEPAGHGGGLMGELKDRAITGTVRGVSRAAMGTGLAALGIGGVTLGRPVHKWVKEHTGSNALGVVAGALAGVLPAMLLSHTVRAPLANLLRGKGMIADAIAGRAGKSMSKLAAGVDGVVTGKSAGALARRTAFGVLDGVSFAVGRGHDEPKGTPFQKRSAELADAVANPAKTRAVVHGQLAGVRAADPVLSDQMEELVVARLAFLHEKMPKDPGTGALLGKRPPWQPTDAEVSKWARYVDAAEHPEHVLHSVADGSVTKEQVDTLKALYPVTYDRVRADIVGRAAELQASLPWAKRLTLSTLFGVPTDGVLKPEALLAMQSTFVEAAANAAAAPPPNLNVKPPEPTSAQRFAAGH